MAVINLPSVPSTNTWAKEHAEELCHGDIVATPCQTAGRGQRGNHWEAQPGLNLTFSIFLRPKAIAPARQFLISEIVSLAVAETLRRHLPESPTHRISVKWPNDIYAGDRKIAGILIEHTVSGGGIAHTVVGIGLNVNQRKFVSDAPNPVSMAMIAGKDFNTETIMHEIARQITEQTGGIPHSPTIHADYLASLWRNDGLPHQFSTPGGGTFRAVIEDVSETGMLRLAPADGAPPREFAFKEVAFIL